jgi:predicted porin
MQKKIIALAIAAAFSAPAFADTTIYGVIDAGYASKSTTPDATGIKTTTSGISFNSDQTTRFGIKQTEDLGNGMKASYLLELGAANATWSADRVLAVALDLGQGTTLIGGRVSSPFRGIVYSNDAMYGANFIGNLVTMDSNLTTRAVAVAALQNFGPVTASVAVLNNTVKTDGVPDVQNGNGVEVTAVYKQDALSVSGGYRSLKSTTVAGAALATDTTTKVMILAANYDFGVAKVYGQFATDKVDEAVAGTSDKKTYETAGVNVPFTSALAGYVELGTGKHDKGAATSPKYSASAVGVRYSLSKNTAVYGHIGTYKEDTVTKSDQFGFGLLHTF